MTHIYLVRHAHSIYTSDERNRPLSEKGMIDAKKATKLLASARIDAVLSSPYKRAIETVDGIAKFHHRKIEIIDELRERKLSSIPVADFSTAITKVWKNPAFSFEGGESNIAAQQRGVQVMNYILKKYEGKNVVVGTHGNIMVLIMNYYDKQYNFAFWRNLQMPDIYKLNFDKITLLDVERIWGN